MATSRDRLLEKFLKTNIEEFTKKTNSKIANKILENFSTELKYFKQVCPIEMLDKLKNPITLRVKKNKLDFEI